MSNTRLSKRKVAYRDDDSGSEGSKSDDKTIPFLRRLRDMLQEHNEVISFHPGTRKNGQVTLGRIVVHDRARVESEVLPRYFNHASFASLRRQLNYFSFTRIGKGRQRGATYINEAVMDLHDILRLKRRPVGTQPPAVLSLTREATKEEDDGEGEDQLIVQETTVSHLNAAVPVVHLPPIKKQKPSFLSRARPLPSSTKSATNKNTGMRNKTIKGPTVVSPRSTSPETLNSSKVAVTSGSRVTLDLTQPVTQTAYERDTNNVNVNHGESKHMLETQVHSIQRLVMDHREHGEDILAGCQALLSISHALRQAT